MNVTERAERACEALWELGGAATLSGLSNAIPDALPNAASRTEALGYAEKQGWITRTARRTELTVKGQDRFGPFHVSRDTVSGPPDPDYIPPVDLLKSVLDRLPGPHAMFTRLAINAIIARRHLADKRNQPYPGFMQIGGSGTGKTTTHLLLCRLFGFNPVPCTVNCTQAHTRGALKGIVVSGHGFQPSPYMSLPYLTFEEVDKEEALIKIVDPYFLGEINHATRGRTYQILPVPMILANPPLKGDRYSLTHPAWRRRSVFLDTQYLTTREKEQIENFAYWLDQPGNLEPGILRLEAFTVPERLSEPGNAMLQCVREVLSPDFRNRDLYSGTGPLEFLALGEIALSGTTDALAAWHVGASYLTIANTMSGQLTPDALALWEKLYDHAGSDFAELRGILRASKSASRLASESARKSAEQASRASAEDADYAMATGEMQFDQEKINALRAVRMLLEIFNPRLFIPGTEYFSVARKFGDELRLTGKMIENARTQLRLNTGLRILAQITRLATPHIESLQQEVSRLDRLEEISEYTESEPEPEPEPEPEIEPSPHKELPSAGYRYGSPVVTALRQGRNCENCIKVGNTVYRKASVHARVFLDGYAGTDMFLCENCRNNPAPRVTITVLARHPAPLLLEHNSVLSGLVSVGNPVKLSGKSQIILALAIGACACALVYLSRSEWFDRWMYDNDILRYRIHDIDDTPPSRSVIDGLGEFDTSDMSPDWGETNGWPDTQDDK